MARNSVASLLTGFQAGYDMTGRVLRDSEIARIAQAMPTEIPDPADPAARKVSFLGKVYDSTPDQVTMDRGRQLAMAGIYDKFGETQRGSEMRQSVRRDEIADQALEIQRQRFDWEKRDQELRAKQQQQAEAYAQAQRAAFQSSTIGQRSQAYAEATKKYTADKAAYDAAVASGDRNAVEPTPPAVTAPTVAEAMLFSAQMLANDAQFGKADPNAFLKLADTARQVQQEGYLKAVKLAQSGAPLTQVLAQFNAEGQMKIDPASVVSDKMVPREGGVQSRVIVLKGQDGKSQVIDTLAELDSLDKADKLFTRAHQINADRRGAAADARGAAAAGRAAEEFNAGAPKRQLEQTLANLNLERLDPKTTPARRQEIDMQLATAKGPDNNAPAQVKLAEALVKAGVRPNMAEALEYAMTAKDKSPEAMRAEIYKTALTANMGDTKRAQAATEEAMRYLGGPTAAPAGAVPGGVPPPAQRTVGKVYDTPRGKLKWDGTGWVQP